MKDKHSPHKKGLNYLSLIKSISCEIYHVVVVEKVGQPDVVNICFVYLYSYFVARRRGSSCKFNFSADMLKR